ncbi:Nicotinamide/nicotinic acid mononucleotide adenylyltransferase 1 [Bulinus truncatus]|nr:Nicotinamide/nicotinic acid mononucleotide adenylyltransferase 1 [Bulinus truncatus]
MCIFVCLHPLIKEIDNMYFLFNGAMGTPIKVILLACGSFSPVTNMHLRMFEIARDALNKTGRFHVVSGIVSPVSDGYNKKDLVLAKHRCEMVRAALKTSEWIKLDPWECTLSIWSPTAKVLRHYKEQYESHNTSKSSPLKKRKKIANNSVSDIHSNLIPSTEVEIDQNPCIKLLCGADLLESFAVPGLWAPEDIEYIVSTHGLVVISRAGSDPQKFIYDSDLLTRYKENIFIVTEWISNEISSTKIRTALRRGDSVKYLLQDSVIEYIRQHQLYNIPDNKYINHMMPSPSNEASNSNDSDEQSRRSSSGEVKVILRSSAPGSYNPSHLTFHRMTTTMDKKTPVTKIVPAHKSNSTSCISDIGTLVRRVRNVRVGFTPETCV